MLRGTLPRIGIDGTDSSATVVAQLRGVKSAILWLIERAHG